MPNPERKRPTPLVIAGCTATGKSAIAQIMAERIGAAVVSADSMLVYRGMDVGTAKPSAEERSKVHYIGLDCVAPEERFSTGDWLECVRRGLCDVPPETPVIAVGGTGLYIKALLEGLDAPPGDPSIREKCKAMFDEGGIAALLAEVGRLGVSVPPGDMANPRRLMRALERAAVARTATSALSWQGKSGLLGGAMVFCIEMDRDALAERIARRAAKMFDDGIVEEAVEIFGGGIASETASGAIGYAEALACARGEITRTAAVERVAARTRQLAKRQRTWFRHQLKGTVHIAVSPDDTPGAIATRILKEAGMMA